MALSARSGDENYQAFTRQDTFDSILNGKKLKNVKIWKDSVIKYSPIGEKKRVVLTAELAEKLRKHQEWLNAPGPDHKTKLLAKSDLLSHQTSCQQTTTGRSTIQTSNGRSNIQSPSVSKSISASFLSQAFPPPKKYKQTFISKLEPIS